MPESRDFNSFGTFLRVMQWTSHCVSRQIDFVAVLVGLWPRFLWCFVWFCCLLWFSAGETQVWLGDLRVVVLVGFCVCVIYRFAYPIGHDCPLYKYFFCLCSCKDRAFSATSATLEEKKTDKKQTKKPNRDEDGESKRRPAAAGWRAPGKAARIERGSSTNQGEGRMQL